MLSITRSSNMFKLKSFLIYNNYWNILSFIGALSFCGGTPINPHALPSLNIFLVQVMVFCKINYSFLIMIEVNLVHITWSHLWDIDNIWTLHGPNKPLQKVSTIPKAHKTKQMLMQKWWWKNYFLHLWHTQKHKH